MFISSLKSVVFRLSFWLGAVASKIWNIKISVFFNEIYTKYYSGWLSGNFRSCGKSLSISYPLHYVGLKHITVGDNFISGPRFRLEAHDQFADQKFNPEIIIGNNVNFNFNCHVGCIEKITIGSGVLIASNVLIIDHNHGDITLAGVQLAPIERPLTTKGNITIEDNVWIGENCVIMPGVSIGKNSIVGSNSVVTKSFGENVVIAGNPAQVVKNLV